MRRLGIVFDVACHLSSRLQSSESLPSVFEGDGAVDCLAAVPSSLQELNKHGHGRSRERERLCVCVDDASYSGLPQIELELWMNRWSRASRLRSQLVPGSRHTLVSPWLPNLCLLSDICSRVSDPERRRLQPLAARVAENRFLSIHE